MARLIPYLFLGIAVMFAVFAVRGRQPGESIFAPRRRAWIILAALFLLFGLFLLRVIRF